MIESQIITRALVRMQQQDGFEVARISTLIGKPQVGKTWWVRNVLAKELNLPVVTLVLSADLPEEVAGYPRYIEGKNNGKLSFLKPAWYPDEPVIIFADELDKAPNETVAPLLTFFREGRIRDWVLPKGSVIVAAANESDTWLEPLKARCLFLPFLPVKRATAFEKLWGDLWSSWSKEFIPQLPEPPKTMESLFFLEKFISFLPEIQTDSGIRKLVLTGLFPSNVVDMVSKFLDERPLEPDYDELVKNPTKFARFIRTLRLDGTGDVNNPVVIAAHFINLLSRANDEKLIPAIEEFYRHITELPTSDRSDAFHRAVGEYLKDIPVEKRPKFNPQFITKLQPLIMKVHKQHRDAIKANTEKAKATR